MTKRLVVALLFFFPLFTAAAVEDELLEPDKAFALTTRVVDGNTLEASWKIAPGYYLYRDKFKFESLDGAVALKPAVLPAGKIKDDQFFGRTEVYTKSVSVRVPIERRPDGAHEARLKIASQGCNEPVGVCYPPITKEVRFKLPALVAKAVAEPKASQIASLKDLAKTVAPASDAEPVDPAKAFRIDVVSTDKDALLARFTIEDCCYLYRDKTGFTLTRRDGSKADIQIGSVALPKGKTKTDEFLGKTEVYYNGFEVRLPVSGVNAARGDYLLKVGYQGCSEKGVTICYPPATKQFHVTAADGKLLVTGAADAGMTSTPEKPRRNMQHFLLAIVAAFGIGLLLTFTPCVLPMIPILSSVIVGSSDRHVTKLEGGLLSSAYVLGTAVTYTVAGVVAATGDQLQAYFQHPVAIVTFSAVLGFLALSMFGFYELQLPAFLQSKLHQHSADIHLKTKHTKVGAFIGVFVMGLISALIVGACVSPLFISALGVAIANRDPVLGGGIMFAMALGMGVILISIGVGAGFLLPKAGAWMNRVKYVFGVMLLGVAIYLLGILPQVPVLLLWAVLFIVSGVYLGATQSLPASANGWQYLWKGFGTVLLIWGVLTLLGGFAGNRDFMNPLPMSSLSVTAGAAAAGTPGTGEHLFERVKSLRELEGRLAEAKAAGKPAMIDYYADWCTDCLRMEKATFAMPAVKAEMTGRFVLLQVDVTDPTDAEGRAMKQRFGVFGPPAMLFFDASGVERRDLRAYGFRGPDELLGMLRQVK